LSLVLAAVDAMVLFSGKTLVLEIGLIAEYA
jgi:hypothetical protein